MLNNSDSHELNLDCVFNSICYTILRARGHCLKDKYTDRRCHYSLWFPLGNHIVCEYILADRVEYLSKGLCFPFYAVLRIQRLKSKPKAGYVHYCRLFLNFC